MLNLQFWECEFGSSVTRHFITSQPCTMYPLANSLTHPLARKRHVSTKALVAALYPSIPLLTKVAQVAAMIPPDLVPAIVGVM